MNKAEFEYSNREEINSFTKRLELILYTLNVSDRVNLKITEEDGPISKYYKVVISHEEEDDNLNEIKDKLLKGISRVYSS